MPSSPSSSVQAARERLGQQLRVLRQDARLTGREFARRAGWASAGVVTMVERGQRAITIEHIRTWCEICGTSDQRRDELLAEQRQLASMWLAYRDLSRQVRLNATQKMGVGDRYDRTRRECGYQTKVIPGLLQTRAYMTGVLTGVRAERHVEVDDVAEAVDERLSRQVNLRKPGKRFVYIVEESVLRTRLFGDDVHREQFAHLLEVMRLPSLSFGVIPQQVDRGAYRIRESFDLTSFDGVTPHVVTIELISGFLTLTHPAEVAMYAEAWDHLAALAVYGRKARDLVNAAMAALDEPPSDG